MGFCRFYFNKVQSKINNSFWSEHKICCGEKNADVTFYVIRRNNPYVGLFSMYIYVLGHIKYALSRNMVPVVDMQHYDNMYMDPLWKGKDNSWTYYFEQLSDKYSLDEVYKSKNVVLSCGEALRDMPNDSTEFMCNEIKYREWQVISNQYIKIKNDIQKMIIDEMRNIFSQNGIDNVLGVMLRGTDYFTTRPHGHPIQPSINSSICAIENIMQMQGYNEIYLSTEDQDILEAMKKHFGTALRFSDVERYPGKVEGFLSDNHKKRKKDYYYRGIDYLIPMGVLMQCKGLFAGRTSGSVGLLLMGMNIEYKSFWDEGNYE